MDKLLQGGTLVTENGLLQADLLITGEKIARIAGTISLAECGAGCEVLDVTGKLVMPGLIDAHTHYQLRSRNTMTADDFLSGSISAAHGGVTTFIDYADHLRGAPLTESVQARLDEALGQSVVDFALHQTITHFTPEVSQDLASLREIGVSSIKIFTTYRREGYLIPVAEWAGVFQRLKEEELLLTVHAEDDETVLALEEEHQRRGELTPEMHPRIRPASAEGIAVERVGELAREAGIPVYIAHLSSAAGLQALRRVRENGGAIYAETTPHYLLLDEAVLKSAGAQKFIMTPPLRRVEDREALWQGLQSEEIGVVATDHCAFTVEQKLSSDNCLTILPGLPGSETMLPLVHHFGVGKGLLTYPQLVSMLSTNPAKVFGLYPEKGSLLPGTDADIVVFDPTRKITLSAAMLHSRAGYTPYEGCEVQGYPYMTILRGEVVIRGGAFSGQPWRGKFVRGGRSSLYE